jgi:LysR family transcriptional regulator, hydrogen peroxide-inducible genes activator
LTLLPRSTLPILAPRLDNVSILNFESPAPTRQLGLAWRRASGSSEEYRAIGDVLRRELASVPGLRPIASGRG